MWQTDAVTIQTIGSVTKVRGTKKINWTPGDIVTCDVQEISKDFVFKEYGITSEGEIKQVFDHTLNTGWVKGYQVLYEGKSYWVKYVNGNMAKMGGSNHVYILLAEVV